MKSAFKNSRGLFAGMYFVVGSFLALCGTHAAAIDPPVITMIDGQAVPPPPAAGSTVIPLSWDDPVFVSMTSASNKSYNDGAIISQKSIADTSTGSPSVDCYGACSVDHVRIKSREGIRCNRGAVNVNWVYMEVQGNSSAGDHADGIQCNVGVGDLTAVGTVTVKNSFIQGCVGGGCNDAYFSNQACCIDHVLENVVIKGGGYGLHIGGDGGKSISLKNVYFITGSFEYEAFRLDPYANPAYGSNYRVAIKQWDNVRYATIVNGQLVMGALIPKPY